MRKLGWLDNVCGLHFVFFPCFLLVGKVWGISTGIGSRFHWLEDFLTLYVNDKKKLSIQCHSLEVRRCRQANQLLLLVDYTQHVISYV
jgi:hypothetical protein